MSMVFPVPDGKVMARKENPESWYLFKIPSTEKKQKKVLGEKRITDVSVYVEAFGRWCGGTSTL